MKNLWLLICILSCSMLWGESSIKAEFSHDFRNDPYEAGFQYQGLRYDMGYQEDRIPPEPPAFWWNNEDALICRWDSHENNAVFAKILPFWIDDTADFEYTFEFKFISIDSHDFHQIAIGFRNMNTMNFSRSGSRFGDPECRYICKDIIEWGYIPDNSFGNPLVYPVIATSRGDDFFYTWPLETTTLVTGQRYRVRQIWDSSSRQLTTQMWLRENNGWTEMTAEDINTPLELPKDRGFEANALVINQYRDYADFWDFGTPDDKNVLEGKIFTISYEIDLNKTTVVDWHLYDR